METFGAAMAEQHRSVQSEPEFGQSRAQRIPGGRAARGGVQADEVFHGQVTTWPAQESPPPKAKSSTGSLDGSSPRETILDSASGTDAADVLPESTTSRPITTSSRRSRRSVSASMI